MNDRDFTNRLEMSLNRGMALVPLTAVEPANARYRIAASKVARRSVSRLTVAIAAVGLALLTVLAGSAASGTGPAILLSTTVHQVVVFVEQVTTRGEPAPTIPTGETGGSPAAGSDSPASGHESVTAPGDTDRAAEPSQNPSPEPVAEPERVAAPQEPSPGPLEEPNPAD